MKRAKLTGLTAHGIPAVVAADVNVFSTSDGYAHVKLSIDRKKVKITTPKGVYVIPKHASLNVYQGIADGHKVHVSLKKVVGEMRFW